MIKAIINGVMALIMSLVSVLLYPIDALINAALPDVANMLGYVSSFFDYIGSFIPWVVSWTGLNSDILSIIVGYYTFKLTVPLLVATIKLALKWYNTLKL